MFVSRKKYQQAVADFETTVRIAVDRGIEVRQLRAELATARNNFDDVIRRALEAVAEVDQLKTELNMTRAAHANREPFSQDLIRSLLVLCHPDKHPGKESAVRVTQQLLKMRK